MNCPDCDGKSYVAKTEVQESDIDDSMVKKRRRVCRECYSAFYTYEVYSKNYRDMRRLSESTQSGLIRGRLKSK